MTRLVSLQDTPQPPGVSPSQPLQSVPSPVSGSEQVNSPGEKSPQLFHHLDSTSVSLQPGLITRTLFFFFLQRVKVLFLLSQGKERAGVEVCTCPEGLGLWASIGYGVVGEQDVSVGL